MPVHDKNNDENRESQLGKQRRDGWFRPQPLEYVNADGWKFGFGEEQNIGITSQDLTKIYNSRL
jgi:hypothetical protein